MRCVLQEIIDKGASEKFYAKLHLIADIESILPVEFKGKTEKDADKFIEKHFYEYKSDNEYRYRGMYEFIEDGW